MPRFKKRPVWSYVRGFHQASRRWSVVAAALAVPAASAAGATPFQWNGLGAGSNVTPTTGNWSDIANWNPDFPVLPSPYLGASDVELIFSHTTGTAAYTSTNNITGAFQLNKLTIVNNGNAASKIGFTAGASLQFVPDAGTNPTISSTSTLQFTIDVPVATTAPLAINQAAAGNLFVMQAVDLGSNALTLSGAGSGQVQFSGAAAIISGTGSFNINLTGGALVASAALCTYSGGTVLNGGLFVASSSSNGTVTPVAGGGVTISGFDAGPLGTGLLTLQKTGTAAVSLRNTTSGTRIVNNEIKVLNDISFLSGGNNQLTLNGAVTLGDATTPAGTQFVVGVTGNSAIQAPVQFAGNIADGNAGGVGIRVPSTSSGALRLSGANTFTGDLTADGGVIQLLNPTSGGAGNIAASAGGRLSFSAAPTIASGKSITVASTAAALGVIGVAYNGVPAFTNTTGGVFAVDVGGTTFNQALDLSTLGNGAMRLGSTFDGQYNATTLVPGTGNVYHLAGSGGALTFPTANVVTGTAAVSVGAGSTVTHGGGTVVFSQPQNYSGATTINGAVLSLGAANALPNTSGVTVGGAGSTLTLTATNALTTTPLALSTGAVVNLNAAGAYGGTTLNMIASGVTVNANHTAAYAGSSNVTVNAGGTLTTSVAGGTPFGSGTVFVDGTLTATGATGSFAGATAAADVTNFVLRTGSTLNLGNGANTNSNRFGDTRTLSLNDASAALLGGTTNTTETIGFLALTGQSNLNINRPTTTNIGATLTIAGIERPNRGMVIVKGTNGALGSTAAGRNNLLITGQAATPLLPPYIIDNTGTNTFTRYIATSPGGVATVTYVAMPATGDGTQIVDVTTAALDLGSTNRDVLAVRTNQNITSTGGATLRIRSGGLLVLPSVTSISAPLIFDAEAILITTPSIALSGKISGPDGFTKMGGGVATLTSPANDYAGQTTVGRGTLAVNAGVLGQGDVLVTNEGILSLLSTNDIIPNTAQVSLLSDGVNFGMVNLAAGVDETVGGLRLTGVDQAPGTYGGTGSDAENILPNYFTGPGVLRVVPEPATAGVAAAVAVGLLLGRRRRMAPPPA